MTQELDPTLVETLRRLDHSINVNEDTSIRTRWEYGRRICSYYELKPFGAKKQLPQGVLATLAGELAVHPSEVSARMKCARMYDTEEKLSTVIERFRGEDRLSWWAIKQHGLTDREARKPVTPKTPLQRASDLIENIEPENLDAGDLPLVAQLMETLRRLEANIRDERKAA